MDNQPNPERSEMTICVDCVFSHCDSPNTPAVYSYRCRHPKTTNPTRIDPVTGQEVYYHLEVAAGKCRDTNERYPYCFDVNVAGQCPSYDPRDQHKGVLARLCNCWATCTQRTQPHKTQSTGA